MATFLRGSYASHENEQRATFLQLDGMRQKVGQLRLVAGEALAKGRALPKAPAGDERTLRGIPVIGAMGGAIMGSRPDTDVPDRLMRLADRFGE